MHGERFEGKVVLVTGGNSGIGLAAAKAFVSEGARVVVTGRDRQTVDAAQRELGSDHLALVSETSSLSGIDQLMANIKERFGRIDSIFINAGIAKFGPFEEISEELFDQTFSINVKGAYFTIQKALPLFPPEGGSIVLNGSINAQLGMPNSSVYAASKAAVISFARTLSAELIGRGIRVNVISPGPISTPLYGRLGLKPEELQGMAKAIQGQVPMKRFGTPEEIAHGVLFLASSDSSFVLGAEIVADGGMSQL
jgi:NAD(P)-dependent dehydrogenase (short-subunit alcohol dehydrogenase family)